MELVDLFLFPASIFSSTFVSVCGTVSSKFQQLIVCLFSIGHVLCYRCLLSSSVVRRCMIASLLGIWSHLMVLLF